MSVAGSLYSGVSGLNANAKAMSVIGNNIANANTIGFKSSRTIFGDLLSSQVSGSGGDSQVGRGVGLSIVDNVFTQGTFENTETNTDLAIEGPGFFIVSDPTTGNASNNYTRSGAFRFDATGNLINPEGYNIMGYHLDDNGSTVGDLRPIAVNTQSFTQAGPTSKINLNTNLNSDAQTLAPPAVDASATALDNAINSLTDPAGATTVFAGLVAADPIDEEAVLTQAATDRANFEGVVAALNNLLSAPEADRVAMRDALVSALTVAGIAPNPAYASFVPADPDTWVDVLEAIDEDRLNFTNVVSAINSLQNAIAGTSFDTANPAATSNYATSIQVFDSLGSTHLMTTYFTKTSDQNWQWNTVVDSGELVGGIPGELAIVGSGNLVFDSSGNLFSVDGQELFDPITGDPVFPAPKALTDAGALRWNNGALQDQLVTIDMQTTQYASPSVVVSQEQDGYGTGSLVKLSVDSEGYVIGNFSNGTPRRLMQLALAKFTNPNALDKIGNNMFAQSLNSGVPVIGTVGSGVGNIFTNALELSNVDLASEFVKMITTQRGFSANSKTITTTDEMLAEVINLKR